MVGQRCRQWANISQALGQLLVFDQLLDTKRWREMNWRQTRNTEDSQKFFLNFIDLSAMGRYIH